MVRRTRSGSARSSTVVTVDFKGVEGRRVVLPEGDYVFRVDQVTKEPGNAADQLVWVFAVDDDGEFKDQKVYYRTSLAPQALWNLRSLLEAMEVEVPDGPLDIDLSEMPDSIVGGQVAHEEYQGRPQARIVDFFTPEDDGADKTKPAAASSKGKGNSLEKLKADDVSEMNEVELIDVVKKYKLDADLDTAKTLRKKVNLVMDALEAAGHLDE